MTNIKRYDVHIYAVVRVAVRGVEATSHAQAIKRAEEQTDFHGLFDTLCDANGDTDNIGFADAFDSYLVDECGDDEHARSKCYDAQGDEVESR